MKKIIKARNTIKKIKISLLIAVFIGIFVIASGCDGGGDTAQVRITVTQDFGNKVVYDEKVQITGGMSVMDVLKENLPVETEYSGSFVSSINGVKSTFKDSGAKEKKDWFFYINGFMAQVGADDYMIEGEDHIVWDYHQWSEKAYSNQIIGSFPQCFTKGYDGQTYPVEIFYSEGFNDSAGKIESLLKDEGVNVKSVQYSGQAISDENTNTILIGDYEDFKNESTVSAANEDLQGKGIFTVFKEGKIVAFSQDMKKSESYDFGCTIYFAQKSYPYASGVLALMGSGGEVDTQRAVQLLCEGKLSGKAAGLVVDGKQIPVPIDEK